MYRFLDLVESLGFKPRNFKSRAKAYEDGHQEDAERESHVKVSRRQRTSKRKEGQKEEQRGMGRTPNTKPGVSGLICWIAKEFERISKEGRALGELNKVTPGAVERISAKGWLHIPRWH